MKPNLQLFRRTRQLQDKIDNFFDILSGVSVIYHLAIRVYLKNDPNDEFEMRLSRVDEMESKADSLRREIEKQLYTHTLIPDTRGDVLELIERVDDLLSQFGGSLWAFANEQPTIPDEFRDGYKKLTGMVIKAADELGLSGRAFFRNPHDVHAYNHKVSLYEREADVISTWLKKSIFSSDLDLAHKLHLRGLVEQIDAIADKSEDIADRLAIYAIKRII